MRLKKKLTKDEFDALSDNLKALYKEVDGVISLTFEVEEDDDSALKRAKDHEKAARIKAEAELKAANLKIQTIEAEKAIRDAKNKDPDKIDDKGNDSIEKAYLAKLELLEKESNEKIAKIEKKLAKDAVSKAASDISMKLTQSSVILTPHIIGRLRAVKNDNDEFVVKVLDADGDVTVSTVDDLAKEFASNKEFESVIVGSKASKTKESTATFDNFKPDLNKPMTVDTLSQLL